MINIQFTDCEKFSVMIQAFIFPLMNNYFWWFKQAVIAILSITFLILGVQTLVASYGLANPLYFIMTFFSSSLIILISLIGILYPAVQVYTLLKQKQ
jgi:di/tricarboxylate transporter